jgi:periplasmic protein CpxP/Spy
MGAGGSMQERMGHGRMERMDPAKMQEMMAKHHAELKTKLKIAPTQEGAWTSFTTAMAPPAGMTGQQPDRAAMEKLTTPERIDKMRAMRVQRDTEMDKRADATKAFYATLNAEQKKVFDAEAMNHGGRHGGHHGDRGQPDRKAPAAPK